MENFDELLKKYAELPANEANTRITAKTGAISFFADLFKIIQTITINSAVMREKIML